MLRPGNLIEPYSGRKFAPDDIVPAIDRAASDLLERGFGTGAAAFLHHGNNADFFIDLLAIWRLGGCAVPLDPGLTGPEIARLAATVRPAISIWRDAPPAPAATALADHEVALLTGADRRMTNALADASRRSVSLDQDALILFTSGTTGQPKGVVHTHRSVRSRWAALWQQHGIARFARTLCLLPTHFGHGLICNALFPWLHGADLFIVPPYRADTILSLGALIDANSITAMSSVPALWRLALGMAREPAAGTLDTILCGSAPLSAKLWNEIRRWSGARQVINAYGITETGSWLAGAAAPAVTAQSGLLGEPWGSQIVICAPDERPTFPPVADRRDGEGHVWVSTPALMRGYFGRDDLTADALHNGWFATGDTGYVDERGYLYLNGRSRDEINRGGMKVQPAEIDSIAGDCALVRDVCTFGYEHPVLGEEVAIAVVLVPAVNTDLTPVREWIGARISRYKCPKRWYLLEAIPRTDRGKVNRARVAQACANLTPAVVEG